MRNAGRRVAFTALLALVGAGAVATAASAAMGETRQRLIRSWPENVVMNGRSVPGRVEIWFDYKAGVAIHKVIANGKGSGTVLKSETFPPGVGTPRPSDEEIAEAIEIVRADKEFASLIAVTHASVDGGFQIFEPAGMPCGPASRCLKVQLMTQDRLGLIRNVVVDLVRQEIVYRAFVPADGGKK